MQITKKKSRTFALFCPLLPPTASPDTSLRHVSSFTTVFEQVNAVAGQFLSKFSTNSLIRNIFRHFGGSLKNSCDDFPSFCEYLESSSANSLGLKMVWQGQGQWQGGSVEFEFLSLFLKSKDYYRILEVDDDATEDAIRSNYLRLALKWHPDKQQDEGSAKSKFQEINEAYKVLSDPIKRREYDVNRICDVQDYNFIEFLHRFKGLILTCNGLGMGSAPRWC